MSQCYQTAINIFTLIFMPGAAGTITLQVPGMTMENIEYVYHGLDIVLAQVAPMIDRKGNIFTAPTCDVKVYIRIDQSPALEAALNNMTV